MGLRGKILSGFVILALMLLIAGFWSIYGLMHVGSSVQKIIDDSLDELQEDYFVGFNKIEMEGYNYAKDMGHEFIELSPEDLAGFYDLLAEEALVAAGEFDAQGLPMTQIFERTRQLIAESQ